MSHSLRMRRALIIAALVAAAAACGGGGSADPATDNPNSSVGPKGLYWSWRIDLEPRIGADGFGYFASVYKYVFRKFFDNGLVYVGPPSTNFGELQCTAPSQDAVGNDLCVPYTIANGQITIGQAAPVSLVPDGDAWVLSGKTYQPMHALADTRLDGSYTSYGCYLAACSRATLVFRPDGTFTASRSNSYANTMAQVFVGAGSATDLAGTYRIDGYRITLTVSNTVDLFFFIDGTTLQIDSDWYLKN